VGEFILGVHGGANACAAIGDRSRVLFCVQEERLTGIKNYMGYPRVAITACLDAVDAKPTDLAHIAYGSRFGSIEHCPREEFLRRLRRFHLRPGAGEAEARMLATHPDGMQGALRRHLANHGLATVPVAFHDHHQTHAAAAYFGLRADATIAYTVLTCDGFGDGACATVSTWDGQGHRELARTDLRNSVGLLYFWTTFGYGFVPHEDEYKLMGMAPYAAAQRAAEVAALLREQLWLDPSGLRLQRAGSLSIERSWPRIAAKLHGRRFDDVFGGLQTFTEQLLTAWAAHAVEHTGLPHLLAGGGVFMNVKANKTIAALPSVASFQAFPSCGDESLAIGAYYLQAATLHGSDQLEPLADCYLGNDIDETEALGLLTGSGLTFHRPADIHRHVARLLAAGEIVARCAGRLEYGARALGNRSILADPANADLPRVLNHMVKQRDFWMPFAPAILASRQRDYLHNPKALPSPYMTMTFDTVGDPGEIIAAVHPADLTARAQIVADDQPSGLREILTEFQALTGRGALLNTSLNLHGEPIAATAADALRAFARSGLRHLQLGPYLVGKDQVSSPRS
jgi:carbamoyltransferase